MQVSQVASDPRKLPRSGGISLTVYYAEIEWKIVKTYLITTIVYCIVNKSVKTYHIHITIYCNVAKSVKIC